VSSPGWLASGLFESFFPPVADNTAIIASRSPLHCSKGQGCAQNNDGNTVDYKKQCPSEAVAAFHRKPFSHIKQVSPKIPLV
jgi:hypothetical protein